MATTPDTDLVTFIAAGGLGLASGTNLFAGPERDTSDIAPIIPAQCVFVLASGGYPPGPIKGTSPQDYDISTVQVTVRSAANDFGGGQTLARNVRNRVHKGIVAGYVLLRVREPEPNYIGIDELGSHTWTLNVEMEHRR